MKKMLEINSCQYCEHAGYDKVTALPICKKKELAILNANCIPSWCPLPDAVSGWRDIADAPKDGTEVLVYFNVADTDIVHIAWYNGHEEWVKSGQYCGSFDNEEDWTGWWSYTRNSVTQEKLDGFRTPTHFLPLPPPPVGK